MAGFINAILLVYSSVTILVGALERVIHPHFEIHSDNLISVSTIGLLVNIVGLFAFGSHNFMHSHNHSQEHSHSNCNHKKGHKCGPQSPNFIKSGMFLHILADTLGSVAVIISSVVIKYTGWKHADTICSVALALMILVGVKNLLRDTFEVLLNCSPKNRRAALSKIQKEVALNYCSLFTFSLLSYQILLLRISNVGNIHQGNIMQV